MEKHQLTSEELEKLRFPIGHYHPVKSPDAGLLEEWIGDIEQFPERVAELVNGATAVELNQRYRPGGWTVKQVIHHCSDSHLNSIIRFKLALTEDVPTIRPYFEDRWAELPDSLSDNIEDSMLLLKALHHKWVFLLRSLTEEQRSREFDHPEHGKRFNLAETIGSYAWHCNHHLAHIQNALGRSRKSTASS